MCRLDHVCTVTSQPSRQCSMRVLFWPKLITVLVLVPAATRHKTRSRHRLSWIRKRACSLFICVLEFKISPILVLFHGMRWRLVSRQTRVTWCGLITPDTYRWREPWTCESQWTSEGNACFKQSCFVHVQFHELERDTTRHFLLSITSHITRPNPAQRNTSD